MLLELNQKNAIVAGLRAIAQQGWGVPDKRPDWAHKLMSADDHDSSLDATGLRDLADVFEYSSQDVFIGPKLPRVQSNGCGKYTYGLKDNEYNIHSPRGDFICKAPNHILAQEICDALDTAAAAKQVVTPPIPPAQLEDGGFIEAKRNVLVPWYSEKSGDVSEITMLEGERLSCHWARPAILFSRDDKHYIARPDEVRLVPPKKSGLKVEPGDDPTGEES